jgi:hypothetical protein
MAGNAVSQNAEDQKQDLSDQMREAVAAAYAFVQGQENTETFSSITFEEALDKQIATLEGPGTDIRPCVLDRIKRVREELLAAVENIKKQPADFFKRHDDRSDAVTEPEAQDPLDTALQNGTTSF